VAARSKAWVRGRSLAGNCGFKSYWAYECQSLVHVVCCPAGVSASGLSLVQRSATECGVLTECVMKPR
jgi:hypothetical protein